MPRLRPALVEQLVLVVSAALATVYAERGILFTPHAYQPDALVHEYWMRQFQDPKLFTDPLTKALIHTGYVPLGLRGGYWLASHLIDPVRFGAWGPVVLAPLSAWLVFRIVREHTRWAPAAWLGAALFILPWSIERFSGTHPRAFAQPVVLLTLYLVLRGRSRWAATVPPIGALLYPPAAIIALGLLCAAPLRAQGRRLQYDRTAGLAAAVSALAVVAALLLPRVAGLGESHMISGSAARRYPEFGPHGQVPFFNPSAWHMLTARYSGFFLQVPGSILLTTAVTIVLLRIRNVRLVRREVWMLAVVSLALFAASYVVLFNLYLPNRYTYPLTPVYCIIIAVCWRPTWVAVTRRAWLWLVPVTAVLVPAVIVWISVRQLPLGARLTPAAFRSLFEHGSDTMIWSVLVGLALCIAALVRRRRHRGPRALMVMAAAIFSGALLAGAVAVAGKGESVTYRCGQTHLTAFLKTLPEDAIIAGDPVQVDCVPIESQRAVVISPKLYQPFDLHYLDVIRPRMFDVLTAYYGDSRRAIVDLRTRYGADYLVVDPSLLASGRASLRYRDMAPFDALIDRVVHASSRRAALELPAECGIWHGDGSVVYDLACVSASSSTG